MKHFQRGLTLVEAMVATAVLAVLAAVAVPSYTNFITGSRVKGAAENLLSDMQYARSAAGEQQGTAAGGDAVSVKVLFGTNCYAIYKSSATSASCSAVSPANADLKRVNLAASDHVTLASDIAATEFNQERGTVSPPVRVTVNSGSYSLAVLLSATGKSKICLPSGSKMSGYPACT